MESEVWKDIPGYEGAYQVSSLGRVRGMDRMVLSRSKFGKEYSRRMKGRELSPGHVQDYAYVSLYPGARTELVHRLVALAFIGPCPEGMEVRHIDGNPENNCACNLEYGTHKENEADKLRHGTRQQVCKLTPEQVVEIRKRIANGESNLAIASEYGVSDVLVSNIRLGKSYRWVA